MAHKVSWTCAANCRSRAGVYGEQVDPEDVINLASNQASDQASDQARAMRDWERVYEQNRLKFEMRLLAELAKADVTVSGDEDVTDLSGDEDVSDLTEDEDFTVMEVDA
jgi:hypothetical protein